MTTTEQLCLTSGILTVTVLVGILLDQLGLNRIQNRLDKLGKSIDSK